jgi:MFS family permease
MLVQAMVAMAVSTLPVLSPVLAETYGIDASLIGIYSSLVFAGATCFTLLGGILVRRFGAIRISQAALLLAASALVFSVLGPLAGLVIFAVATGMGYGLATPAASHILARVTPENRRGIVFSIKQSAVPVGGLLAGLIVPVAAIKLGWQEAVMGVAVVVAITALIIRPLRPSLDDDRDPRHPVSLRAPFASIASVMRHPRLRTLALTTLAFTSFHASIFAVFTAFLVDRGGLTLIVAGQVFAAMQVAGVAARIGFGWLTDHVISARRLMVVVGVSMAFAGAIVGQIGPDWPIAAVFGVAMVVGVAAAGWPGIYLAEIVRVVPSEQVSSATGGTVAFSFTGVVVGPALFSVVVTISGSYALAFSSFGAVAGVIAVGLWLAARRAEARG